MDRIFYGVGGLLSMVGLCLFDYRLAMVLAGSVCLGLGFLIDLGTQPRNK